MEEEKQCPNCERMFKPSSFDQICCCSNCTKAYKYLVHMKRLKEGRV